MSRSGSMRDSRRRMQVLFTRDADRQSERRWRRHLGLLAVGVAAFVSWGCSSPSAPSCAYTVSSTSASLPPGGGSDTVAVTTGQSCAWTAASNAGWLTITSGATGTGNGTVTFSAGASGTVGRSATLTVAGQAIAVSQGAQTFSLSGTVTDAFIGPALGLPGVAVTVIGGPSAGAAVTDPAGSYTLTGLFAGAYTITFFKAAYVMATATVQLQSSTTLPMALSLDVPASPSAANLTGYWTGTGTYPNAPFKLALVHEGGTLRGTYVDQHDLSMDVSGAAGSPQFTLRVNFGDAVLFLECEIEDAREVNGVQRTSALGNRPYPFTMKR